LIWLANLWSTCLRQWRLDTHVNLQSLTNNILSKSLSVLTQSLN
jgi:hypothetical protein